MVHSRRGSACPRPWFVERWLTISVDYGCRKLLGIEEGSLLQGSGLSAFTLGDIEGDGVGVKLGILCRSFPSLPLLMANGCL